MSELQSVEERKPVGLHDIDGKEIFTGDVVEFYFCTDKGHSKEPSEDYTRMRDLVIEDDGEFYFVCGFGGSPARLHSDYCRVIGTDPSLIDT